MIRMTRVQKEIAKWALPAMDDHWHKELERPDLALPDILGDRLLLSTCAAVNRDLLYRVGEQFVDITDGEPTISDQKEAGQIRAAGLLADKIRAEMVAMGQDPNGDDPEDDLG